MLHSVLYNKTSLFQCDFNHLTDFIILSLAYQTLSLHMSSTETFSILVNAEKLSEITAKKKKKLSLNYSNTSVKEFLCLHSFTPPLNMTLFLQFRTLSLNSRPLRVSGEDGKLMSGITLEPSSGHQM